MLRIYSALFRTLVCFFLLPASFAAAFGDPTVLGAQNIAVLPVTFKGSDGNPIPMVPAVDTNVVNQRFNLDNYSYNQFLKEFSDNKAWFVPLTYPAAAGNPAPLYVLDAAPTCVLDDITRAVFADPRIMADTANLANFDRIFIIVPNDLGNGMQCYIGSTTGKTCPPHLCTVKSTGVWWKGAVNWFTTETFNIPDIGINGIGVLHDVGHGLGLPHANSWACGSVAFGDPACKGVEYGNLYDMMGGQPYGGHFNGYRKDIMGWLGNGELQEVTASGEYSILPLSCTSSTCSGQKTKVLKVRRNNAADPSWFYIEHRRPIGADARLGQNYPYYNAYTGAILNYVIEQSTRYSYLIDTTPDSFTDDHHDRVDSALEPDLLDANGNVVKERYFLDGQSGFFIKTLGRDEAANTLKVQIKLTCGEPVIAPLSLTGSGPPGTAVTYNLTVTNTNTVHCARSVIRLGVDVAALAGWSASSSSITLDPGATGSLSITVTPPLTAAPGSYALTLSATLQDNPKLKKVIPITQTVRDNISPSVTSLSNGAFVRGVAKLSATATDNTGVTQVSFYLVCTNFTLISTSQSSPYSVDWNTTGVPNGVCNAYAVAFDAAGNVGYRLFSVTVDNLAPSTPTSISAAGGKGKITVSWQASTDVNGIAFYDVLRTSSSGATTVSTVSGQILSFVDSPLKKGTKMTYQVRARDTAGNTSAYSAKVKGTAK